MKKFNYIKITSLFFSLLFGDLISLTNKKNINFSWKAILFKISEKKT